MEKIPEISGVLRGNCCEIYRNIPQKYYELNKKLQKALGFLVLCTFGNS